MAITELKSPWTPRAITIAGILLFAQFVAAYIIGSGGLLTNDQ